MRGRCAADGLVGDTDVGDLSRLVQMREGRRPSHEPSEVEGALVHELCDCLWVLLTLADRYEIDLDTAFPDWVASLETWLTEQS